MGRGCELVRREDRRDESGESAVYHSIFDQYYSRGDTLDLLGPVAGQTVLDAGCGLGLYAVDLSQAGAIVTGIDLNEDALRSARASATARTSFIRADLNEPLEFLGYRSFDAILCSLVLHYIEDWSAVLSEFKHLLKPHGRLALSVQHPFADYFDADSKNYYNRERWYSGNPDCPFWRRSLEEIMESLAGAGFAIDRVREPSPICESESSRPSLPRLLVVGARLQDCGSSCSTVASTCPVLDSA